MASLEQRGIYHKFLFGRGSLDDLAAKKGKVIRSFIAPSPPHQNFDKASAPIPIIQLSSDYISGQTSANLTVDGRLPPFDNKTSIERFSHGNFTPKLGKSAGEGPNLANQTKMKQRATSPTNPIQCDVDQPCADGSCCNKDRKCGYGPSHCGASNCTSNCDATAMCGIDSAGGNLSCSLNLCCSYYGWCGTESIHCINSDTEHNTAPCQQGYGGCKIVPPPVCGNDSGTASRGRKVAYYQASNVRSRSCNRVDPKQINTKGLTHLIFAFAAIDPTTFKITPSISDDVNIYKDFTALKTATMQTWIGVGGFDFSDQGPTHTTWSDMASTPSSRASFISSLVSYMTEYGFDGVDLDWEYPAADTRGGRPEDTKNFVSLVQEMRKQLGDKGISLTLAPDYWYLRGFDPKAMEPSVDFFGFMSYDLHGSWDANIKTLGAKIRPQTDIRDIDQDLLPLWFDAVNPAKVNFGLAYYGRGYTVSRLSPFSRFCMVSRDETNHPSTSPFICHDSL